MTLDLLLHSIQNTALAADIRGDNEGSGWLFPIIEIIHVLAIAIVFGSIAMVDARLVGLGSRDSRVTDLSRELLPLTWSAFACACVSGLALFSSKAVIYAHDRSFQLKFIFMATAALNMLIFHFGTYRSVSGWDWQIPPPRAARAAGVCSLVLWVAVIFMGRWIGFTT